MAKRQTQLDNIFARTEPAPSAAPAPGQVPAPSASSPARPGRDRTVSVGVGLRLSELAQLDAIAGRRGMTRNALMREIVRRFLAGEG